MSYCLNPKCPNPTDSANEYRRTCCQCGSDLLLEGRYRVIKPLAGGGVVKTFEIDDQGQCKVLKVLFENHPQEIALFKQKAKVLSRLNYPGLPKINPNGYFTYLPKGSNEAFHCLVMEKFDQPENIIRKPNGQLVLIAFGAKWEVTDSFVPKINEGQNVTRIVYHQYIPPEQTHGNPVPQSDFFALGRTFVYLLTGKPPSAYSENPRTGKLFWRECAPHISDEFGDLIDNLMAHSPDNRPQTPQAILQRLADFDLKQTEKNNNINVESNCLVMEKFDQPQNILRKPNGQLLLIAFGSKWEVTDSFVPKINESQNITRIVRHEYIPPEQTHGNPVPQSDFFALGRTFVYLLTGKPPSAYSENPRTGKLFWRECAPNISDEFADLVDNLMAPFLDDRPQNPKEILQHLEDLDLKRTEKNNNIKINLQSQPSKFTMEILSKIRNFFGL